MSNWAFVDRKPTSAEVVALIQTLPSIWGVDPIDFIDYVQPLPQRAKKRDENNEPIKDNGRDVYEVRWTLYMSVAGREMMMVAAQEINNWRVEYVPSDYLRIDEKSAGIYRETIEIWERDGHDRLGQRTGTARLRNVERPAEVAETAARGRAIAAWGLGVLPGSGVASLDEMQGITGGELAEQPARREEQPAETKGDLLQEVLTLAEELRQLRAQDENEMRKRLADYIRQLGVEIAQQDEEGNVVGLDWSKVAPAQLKLLRQQQRKSLSELKSKV